MSVRVGLFVGTSNRMPSRVPIFVDICVGFDCRKLNSKKVQ